MTRNQMFGVAMALAVGGFVCLFIAMSMLGHDIRSHLSQSYALYKRDSAGENYQCSGSPRQTADDIASYEEPEARASNGGSEYLRYDDDIVIVGPDGTRPCTVRIEDTDARYSHGQFVYLGPGFNPGSPAGGAGGSSGGPDGAK